MPGAPVADTNPQVMQQIEVNANPEKVGIIPNDAHVQVRRQGRGAGGKRSSRKISSSSGRPSWKPSEAKSSSGPGRQENRKAALQSLTKKTAPTGTKTNVCRSLPGLYAYARYALCRFTDRLLKDPFNKGTDKFTAADTGSFPGLGIHGD